MRVISSSSARSTSPHIPRHVSPPSGFIRGSPLTRIHLPLSSLTLTSSTMDDSSNITDHDQTTIHHPSPSIDSLTPSRMHHPRQLFLELGSPQHYRRGSFWDTRPKEESSSSKKSRIGSAYEDVALQFDIIHEDGGHYSPLYSINNILQDNSEVYCSARHRNINILLRFNGSGYIQTDSSCVITQLIVKSPMQGFTAPCKDGIMFISHEPIPIESTLKFDDYTYSDYKSYIMAHTDNPDDPLRPVAFFSMSKQNGYVAVVDLPSRSGRYVLIKLLRSEGTSDNIDLQYIGLIGFAGARAFASGTLC